MLIDRITQARLPERPGWFDLTLEGGQVTGVTPTVPAMTAGERCLEADGRVVLPALVDAHVHLDKSFLLTPVRPDGPRPTLEEAIRSVADVRSRVARDVIHANAERAVTCLVRHGVTAARVHVEIDVLVGLDLVRMHQALAEAVAPRIKLQLVAFPQRGLSAAGMPELLEAALAQGVEIVGGCPYVDTNPQRHLDIVFAIAERYGAPVDLHLDFSDDPSRSLLRLVAERTRALGMSGRVTIGHVTTLAAMDLDAQHAALDLLAQAGISLVVLPATDLYLGGHGEPGTRSLAPIERALAAGVRVAIANNNLDNPFARFGNGNLVQAAWLAGIMRRAASVEERRALLDCITTAPASILGLSPHGPEVGSAAHLAVFDTAEVDEVIRLAANVVATLRDGRLVHTVAGPHITLAAGV